jgi:hypothetical protein
MFNRALRNLDIATGTVDTAAHPDYATNGTADTWAIKNANPPDPVHFCFLWDVEDTCTEEQIQSILDGSAVIVSGLLKDANSTRLFPEVFNGTGAGNGSGEPTPTGSEPSPTESGPASSPTESGSAASSLIAAGVPGISLWAVLAALGYAVLA